MRKLFLFLPLAFAASSSLFAQDNLQSLIVKHLKTSRDFCLKVAEAMPVRRAPANLTNQGAD